MNYKLVASCISEGLEQGSEKYRMQLPVKSTSIGEVKFSHLVL